MTRLVHPDQAGFIPTRGTAQNVHRLLSLMESAASMEPGSAVLAIDIEKAFDSLEWDYLYMVLAHMGLGEGFIKWTKLLYADPKARVRTGTFISARYSVGRCTRQGCPLSPLLFALVMEPLAAHASTAAWYQGQARHDRQHVIALYEDDLLLFLRNTGLER
ncbi:hypothetical protein NDU88_002339 [Pleurodeles waltl]|uniref:Reverse transcriptase domain-containing protein n=1 Tax=Pleurodeles waltl TaxID=8319 RepID=A0AAV7WPP0_PLEWA|nr:hypothetical protein NDU88_002339 [Pleurodeles waltl]